VCESRLDNRVCSAALSSEATQQPGPLTWFVASPVVPRSDHSSPSLVPAVLRPAVGMLVCSVLIDPRYDTTELKGPLGCDDTRGVISSGPSVSRSELFVVYQSTSRKHEFWTHLIACSRDGTSSNSTTHPHSARRRRAFRNVIAQAQSVG